MANELEVITKDLKLEPEQLSRAQTIFKDFTGFLKEMHDVETKCAGLTVTDVSQTKEMKLARESRLELKNVRVAAEKTKDRLKAGILSEGRVIDGIYNVIRGTCEKIEANLKAQEEYAERIEKARKEAVKADRVEKLTKLEVDTSYLNLEDMPEETFVKLLESSQIAYDQAKARAAQIEKERVEEEAARIAEQKRLAEENERLKKEAEAREATMAKELAKQEAIRKAEQEKAEAAQKAAQAQLEKERAEQAEKLRREIEAREAVESEQRRKDEAERQHIADRQLAESRARAEKEASELKAKQAPDKEKIISFAQQLRALQSPIVSTDPANAIVAKANQSILAVVVTLEQEAGKL